MKNLTVSFMLSVIAVFAARAVVLDEAYLAADWPAEYGISLEQGAVMFIEEFVRAKGDMEKASGATTERMQRVRNSSI